MASQGYQFWGPLVVDAVLSLMFVLAIIFHKDVERLSQRPGTSLTLPLAILLLVGMNAVTVAFYLGYLR